MHNRESASEPAPWPGRALTGFLASMILMGGAAAFLLTRHLIPWPFHGAETPGQTYGRIAVYLPFSAFALISVFWIKQKKQPVSRLILWNRFSPSFFYGLAISAGYSLTLYLSHDFVLKGAAFVPPALIMGVLNAVSEEILFRLVFFTLLIQRSGSWPRANLMQAMVYGFIHLFIGGPVFFLYAAGYGLLLGWITKTNESVLPAIICHFIADIGAIGLPLLILT